MPTKIQNTQMNITFQAPDVGPFKFKPTATDVGKTTLVAPSFGFVSLKDVYRNGLLLCSPEDYLVTPVIVSGATTGFSIEFVKDNAFQLGDIYLVRY